MVRVVISSLFVGFFALASWSQENKNLPPLERTLNVKLESNSRKEALKIMEAQGEFSFAYKTTIVDSNQRLSRSYQDQTTREILDDIFQGELTYQGKGNYIILRTSPKLRAQEVNLEGYILDLRTGEKIPFATVYDTVSFTSTVSDEYGHYTLKMTNPSDIYLNVKKAGYIDTAMRINKTGTEILNFRLRPESTEVIEVPIIDSADFFSKLKNMKFLKISEERKANILNFKEQLKTKVQFSLAPVVGTNGLLSSSTVVDYSVNLFGGFNGGVRKAEIAGFFNIDVDTVQYFQAAGFLNAVGGYQKGVQLAGFTNLNNDSFKGGQFAGFFNTVRKDFNGVQAAGFGNITLRKFDGIQAAGFFNAKGDSGKVVQLAGFSNFAGNSTKGAQFSGFVNYVRRDFIGGQAAGFINYAGMNFKGVQLSGFMNYARKDFRGVQASGFINIATNVKGVQLSFININDTISGVPIGFFSFSRKGLHQLEVSTNEFLPFQLAFKTGTKRFYNSFIGAMRTGKNSAPIWAYGYGIGTSVDISPKSSIFFDVQALGLQKAKFTEANVLGKLTISYQYQVKKMFAVSAGPSFNVYSVSEASTQSGMDFRSIAPYNFYNKTSGSDNNVQMWIGGHISLRFF